jgi:hypothetical protein
MLDLLELYTGNRKETSAGTMLYEDDMRFVEITIMLNKEAHDADLPRYATLQYIKAQEDAFLAKQAGKLGTHENGQGGKANGGNFNGDIKDDSKFEAYIASGDGVEDAERISHMTRDGTVRFMLDPERAQREKDTVKAVMDDVKFDK